MIQRREWLLILRGLVVLVPGGLGWLIYQGAAYLVGHSEIEIQLSHAGFGFVSYAAETVYFVGTFGTVAAGLFFGLLGSVIYLRQVGSLLAATVVNVITAVILISCAGTFYLFPVGFLLWAAAMIWVSVHRVDSAQSCASPNEVPVPGSGASR